MAEIKPGGMKRLTTGGDTMDFTVPSVDDLIKADRYNNRKARRPRCIRLVMERRV